jgi:hypothetical protein
MYTPAGSLLLPQKMPKKKKGQMKNHPAGSL